MKLDALLSGLLVMSVVGDRQQEVTQIESSLTYDFEKRGPFPEENGVLFVHQGFFAPELLDFYRRQNVHMLVLDRIIPEAAGLTVIQAINTFEIFAQIAARFHGDPSNLLTVIGVTGTNGKTSVTHLLDSVLREAGHKTALFGTLGYRFAEASHEIKESKPLHHLTTPQANTFHALLQRAARSGATHAILEVSSQAVVEHRLSACHFDLGVFTNFSDEHHNYHLNTEEYFEAKLNFFARHLRFSGKKNKRAVINTSQPEGRTLLKLLRYMPFESIGFSRHEGFLNDIYVRQVSFSLSGVRAEIVTPRYSLAIRSPLLGVFQLQNIVAAAAAAYALEIDKTHLAKGIAACRRIPGRFEKIPNQIGIKAYFDWAHSLEGYRQALRSAKRYQREGKLAVVAGLEDDASQEKQKKIFEIIAAHADYFYLSLEGASGKVAQIAFRKSRCSLHVFDDPLEALTAAVKRTRLGDTLLTLGWEVDLVGKGEAFLNSFK